jgi:hypothetical protein
MTRGRSRPTGTQIEARALRREDVLLRNYKQRKTGETTMASLTRLAQVF